MKMHIMIIRGSQYLNKTANLSRHLFLQDVSTYMSCWIPHGKIYYIFLLAALETKLHGGPDTVYLNCASQT